MKTRIMQLRIEVPELGELAFDGRGLLLSLGLPAEHARTRHNALAAGGTTEDATVLSDALWALLRPAEGIQ